MQSPKQIYQTDMIIILKYPVTTERLSLSLFTESIPTF